MQLQTAPTPPDSVAASRHILTVSVEDYFQAPAFRKVILEKHWSKFEVRLEKSTFAALNLLHDSRVKATFFMSSWTAERAPSLVREIVSQGHEIGSSGVNGVSFRFLSESQLRDKARISRETLEDISGSRVHGYRVADLRLTAEHLWALPVLAELGYSYDSSFSPTLKTFHNDARRFYLHREEFDGKPFYELPLPTASIAGLRFPIAGGNYFRQLPQWILRREIRQWVKSADLPFVLYFRVWDLDPSHPRITGVPMSAHLRHYRNAGKMPNFLKELMAEMSFASAAEYLHLSSQLPAGSLASRRVPEPPRQQVRATTLSSEPLSSDSPAKTEVTIVVPCYNEEASLPYLVNNLRELEDEVADLYSLHYVFVDDCSKDHTWAKLKLLFGNRPNTLILRHPANRGITAAIFTGVAASSTEIICSIDCDCTYDPIELKTLIPLLRPDVACVTASPYHPDGKVLNVPHWRLFVSSCASRAYQIVLSSRLHTFTSCFRVYRRSMIADLDLQESGFVGVAELIGKLILRGRVVEECASTLSVRVFGQTKMKVFRNSLKHLRLLSKLALFRLPDVGKSRSEERKLVKNGVSRG